MSRVVKSTDLSMRSAILRRNLSIAFLNGLYVIVVSTMRGVFVGVFSTSYFF